MDKDTGTSAYTEQLVREYRKRWKKIFKAQLPYILHLKYLRLKKTLDIGCGIGRNLCNLPSGSVGVDTNPFSVNLCKENGYNAFLPEDFYAKFHNHQFNSLLFSHILEHLSFEQIINTLSKYLPYLKSDGRIVIIIPQELGFKKDHTHITNLTDADIERLCQELNLTLLNKYSFPFIRLVGKFFRYNETILILTKTSRFIH